MKNTRGDRRATCSGVTRALPSAPERFVGRVMLTERRSDSINDFNVIAHTLVDVGVEAKVGRDTSYGA